MDTIVNTPDRQMYISVSNNNNIFFSSDDDAYMSGYLGNDLYSEPSIIEHPARTNDLIGDIFMDPDENHIIYAAVTPESEGNKDLYITYNNYGLYYGDFTYSKNFAL